MSSWTDTTPWPVVDDFVAALPLGAAAKDRISREIKGACEWPSSVEYLGKQGEEHLIKITPGSYAIVRVDPASRTAITQRFTGGE